MNKSGALVGKAMLTWVLLGAVQAHAAIEVGAVDPVTGQSWIQAGSLAEGASLGYRAATREEFVQYLSHGGFGTPSSTQEFFSRTVASPLMGFTADTYVRPASPAEYSGVSVVMGWLDADTTQLGAIMSSSGWQLTNCPGTTSYSCYTSFSVHEAAYGSLSAMLAGNHDRYAYGQGGDWAPALSNLRQADGSYKLSYFMIAEVPEPSTYALMSLGLAGVLGLARRRRH